MGLVRRLFRRSFDQVEAYAAAWEQANGAALADAIEEALAVGDVLS